MAVILNDAQQFYFDRIKSKKLKSLIAESYSFSTINDDKKLNLLINASITHKVKGAEKELIKMFEYEAKETNDAIKNTKTLTPKEEKKQFQILEEENTAIKENITKLKKVVIVEKERISKKGEKKKEKDLLKKLKQI